VNIYEKLINVQAELKAPKSQFNSFGKYNYRSLEDISEAAKPLLKKHGLVLTIADKIILVGDRNYIEATATLTDCEKNEQIINTASAREAENKKGMDESQITGAASSYARKYCLNGLFCIDDTKDADSMDNRKQGKPEPVISEEQASKIALVADEVDANEKAFCKYFGIKEFDQLPASKYKQAMAMLESKRVNNENN